jgi:Flp pilus assembly protein TadG
MRCEHQHDFLARLARDRRGNTIAIMAAALVPLMGFAGSAVDFARMYTVRVRLQQACDAGVLAGRKAMTDTSLATPLDTAAQTQATTFFNNNFPAGYYQTTNITFTPTKAADAGSTVANTVQGTASVRLPMAVMSFFGIATRDLVATCQARFDLADADIMFVLDTTGSMACVPSAAATCGGATTAYTRADGSTGYAAQEATGSKMQGLRDAVILFDTTMRANADATTNFRYGFVTYSSSVNVGGAIPPQFLQNTTWTYESRRLSPTVNTTSGAAGDYNFGSSSSFSFTGVAQTACVAQRLPASGFALQGPAFGNTTSTWSNAGYVQARHYRSVTWTSANGGTCSGTQQALRPLWRYEPVAHNVSAYVASLTSTNPAVTVPSRFDGLTSRWRGCIEEVNTSADTSFSVGNLPDDLDPDFTPTDATNMWRPAWPEVTWLRGNTNSWTDFQDHLVTEGSIDHWEDYNFRPGLTLDLGGFAACGMPAQRLRTWTAQQVSNYVNDVDFKPFGGTYHDAGMIWGTRMLSPDGVFAADTAPWPGRNPPSRSIVFMTDGFLAPNAYISGLYGPEAYSKKITGTDLASQTARHNARFRIVCDAAKAKGIVIYVVAFGASVGITDDLRYCASPGQAFQASDTAGLRSAFQTIAQRVASLRITQ